MRSWAGVAQRVRAVDPLAADLVLAAVVAALSLAQLAAPSGHGAVDPLGAVVTVVLCAPLAARSRAPRLALVAMTVVATGYALLDYPQVVMGLPLVVAIYAVGARHGLRASAGVLALLAALLAVSFTADQQDPGLVDLVVTVATLGAAWWAGATVRGRREQVELLEERSALLERVRRDEAGQAVARERLRIARELHDVVAHSMSVVAVQSGMAQHVLATQPERAGAALAAISQSSRAALVELRRLLGVLRADDEPEGSLAPALGLADLPALVERIRDAGVRAELSTTGEPGAVPAAVGLTAYRIVQEALTNTVRHAGPGSTATVSVTCGPTAVDVLVADDGTGAPAPVGGAGSGLVGMRERVDVFGGDLAAGPSTGGGWRVAAHLPLDVREPA
jgi:signal transduction histidine kinase